MDRKELYAKIKEYQLEEVVKSATGRNYTQVSNATLNKFITDYKDAHSGKSNIKNTYSGDSSAFDKLVEVLEKKHILLKSEVSYIYS